MVHRLRFEQPKGRADLIPIATTAATLTAATATTATAAASTAASSSRAVIVAAIPIPIAIPIIIA